MKILALVNPISGDRDKAPIVDCFLKLCRQNAIDGRIYETTGEQDLEQFELRVKREKPDRVVAIGGDGTVLLASRALLGCDVPIVIVPMGSANGVATELNIPSNPKVALNTAFQSGECLDLDLLKVNDEEYCIHLGDVGVNAEIVKSYEKDDRRGLTTYAKYLLEKLQSAEPFRAQIETDTDQIDFEGVMLALCNCRKYGTGVCINRGGVPTDGVFEIVGVKAVSNSLLLKAGLSVIDEGFMTSQDRIELTAKRATITLSEPKTLQLDGELKGKTDRIEMEIVAGGAKILTA